MYQFKSCFIGGLVIESNIKSPVCRGYSWKCRRRAIIHYYMKSKKEDQVTNSVAGLRAISIEARESDVNVDNHVHQDGNSDQDVRCLYTEATVISALLSSLQNNIVVEYVGVVGSDDQFVGGIGSTEA